MHFYPRSPCGERQQAARFGVVGKIFLSTLSLRRATTSNVVIRDSTYISIHALLAESDLQSCCRDCPIWDFYPRSPCGERPCPTLTLQLSVAFLSTLSLRRATQKHNGLFSSILFLSTLSLRRATRPVLIQSPAIPISIHALLAESDHRLYESCLPR